MNALRHKQRGQDAKRPPTALAIAAHPDDIEFMMAGTLLLLREAGFEIHYLNVASGSCGSLTLNASAARTVRRKEAQAAARILGAHYHPGFADDLEITYDVSLLRRMAAVVREVRPAIVLTHSLEDYMEDHMAVARLAVTAAFARGMRNFVTRPARPPFADDVTLYHALPHGLRDGMGKKIVPELLVDTTAVQSVKREALAAHRSQQEWLATSQGMNSYLATMDEMAREVGALSRHFRFAEGWRRHHWLGLSEANADPLSAALKSYCRRNAGWARA